MSTRRDKQVDLNRAAVAESADVQEVQQVQEQQDVTLIYVGPSLKTLQKYSVFQNGLPAYVDEHIEKCPAIRGLLIPVDQLAAAEQSAKEMGSKEAILSQTISDYAGSEQ
ncbi:hypothetical protein QK289_04085 [Exiguobacterium antarcticum]|uniref:Uncharacterized protein n=1 Tax=Exiguobacterium antarcticum TaxID=132920 RepID=A0ABT6R050_9BACL|nr:hypothetical protein [Exiguobacterium antarcticum]MDI3234177.1 hypothetical protein [Exiguobacterium antarcticum]